jgi:hypothetical protein
VGCINPSTATGDIICVSPTPVAINVNDVLTPTWLEPSTGTSVGDNSGTAVVDIYGLRSTQSVSNSLEDIQRQVTSLYSLVKLAGVGMTPGWVKIAANAQINGRSVTTGVATLVNGVFTQIKVHIQLSNNSSTTYKQKHLHTEQQPH